MLPQAHIHRNSVVLLALLFLALESQVSTTATAAAASAHAPAVLAAAALYAPTADADDAVVTLACPPGVVTAPVVTTDAADAVGISTKSTS